MIDKHLNNYKRRKNTYIVAYEYQLEDHNFKGMHELFVYGSKRPDLFKATESLRKQYNAEALVITNCFLV